MSLWRGSLSKFVGGKRDESKMADDSNDEDASFYHSTGENSAHEDVKHTSLDGKAPSPSIQDYALQAFLGEGSTAHVYLATHSASGDSVAIKVIDKLLVRQAQMQHKVQREILIHSTLLHRHVVGVKQAFEDARNHYLVLEYCERGSVASLLRALRERGATLDETTAKGIFRQTAHGLAYLHARGIIHRDLKLSNLLLTRDGDVKISDFGLATFISEEHATVCGTPNFIAPEVLTAEAESSYDETVDIWSLGCILYTLLLGKPPFEGSKVSDTLANVSNAGRQPLQFPRGFSATSGDLIKRMLNVDASARPTVAQILNHQWLRLLSPTRTGSSSDESDSPVYKPRHSAHGQRAKANTSARAKTTTARRRRSLGDKQRKPVAASYRRPVAYETDESSFANHSDAPSYSSLDLDALELSSSSEIEEESSGDLEITKGHTDNGALCEEQAIAELEDTLAAAAIAGRASSIPVSDERQVSGNGQALTDTKDVLFLSLRIEVTDLALLDIAPDATREIVWDCWETSDIRQLTRFTLACNGWELEYVPSRGLLQGTSAHGSAINYQCPRSKPSLFARPTLPADEDRLIQLLRLCLCLSSRSLQLRHAAMAIDIENLPIIHYDKLPMGVLESLRRESVRAMITRQLGTLSLASGSQMPTALHDDRTSVRCTIPGIGRGVFDDQGRLKIEFFGGATLEMNASGSTIRYRRSPADAEDEFDLSSTPFLPTEVKQYFEHVPAFVRQLKTP